MIAFHSLEDREVKHTFRALAPARLPPPHQEAGARRRAEETARNPRARSARLRAIERVEVAA